MPKTPCPYCGQPHDSSDVGRCDNCNGLFEPLSRMATQLAMGPWYVRDEDRPFMPGFSEAILRQQVAVGRINANTIVRGPTTHQFWMNAGSVPGLSRLMGTCHACSAAVSPQDTTCKSCQADLSLPDEIDRLGLAYTTADERANAQQEINAKRTSAKPTPAPKSAPTASKDASVVDASLLQPVKTRPVEAVKQDAVASDSLDAHDIAEDVWHAGPATARRRRKRSKGPDPLVVGMAVMLLCVVALGLVILLTGGTKPGDDDSGPDDGAADKPIVQRDAVTVSRASIPVLTAYERLNEVAVPPPFAERYAEVKRLIELARTDQQAERFNPAYEAYAQAGALIQPLEADIAQWQLNEQARGETIEVRDRVTALRSKAEEANATRWSAEALARGQAAWDQAVPLLEAGQYAEARDVLAEAESAYQTAAEESLAGQAAGVAQAELDAAMKASGSEQSLRTAAEAQVTQLTNLRSQGEVQLSQRDYAKAEQSFKAALVALREAEEIVKLSRYKKVIAYEAGYSASAIMLAAARGEGIDAQALQKLSDAYAQLRLSPNPAAKVTAGKDVGFTAAMGPLVNEAREAITSTHGTPTQASYQIGFNASIIEQTLGTKALTDEQQKRIHQCLGVIEQAAEEAGWDINQLRPVIDQVRTANRNAKLGAEPEPIRIAWKKLVSPVQDRESASRLMDPVAAPKTPNDPELFPGNGS